MAPVFMLELLFAFLSEDYIKAMGVLSAFMLAGFLIMQINLQFYHAHDYENALVEITAVQTDKEGVLRDLVIDGKRESGKMQLPEDFSVKGRKKLTAGSVVRFTCKLGDVQIDRDGIETTQYRDGIRYYATEVEGVVEVVAQNSPTFDESVRLYVKDMLFFYLGEDNGAVAYAMTVGDTDLMDPKTLDGFRATGTAHVFAVSGLHVGFLVMLINAAVRRRRKLAFCFTIPITLFYAYVCGFSPGIMRACLMTWLLLAVKISGREPDFLSSIAFAALIILAIKPFFLFDVGFQMSLGAVIGICFVTGTLRRTILGKGKIASAFALSIGATLGTAPFLMQYFDGVSTIGIIFNVIAIPVVSLAYMATLVCLICPVLFFLFPAIGCVLDIVIAVTQKLSTSGMLDLLRPGLCVAPYFLLLYAASGNLDTRIKPRVCFAAFNCLAIACTCLIPSVSCDGIEYCYTDGMTVCATTAEGEKYLFTELSSYEDYLAVRDLADDGAVLYILDFDKMRQDLVLMLSEEKHIAIKSLSWLVTDDKYYALRRSGIDISRVHEEDNGGVKISALEYFSAMLAIRIEIKGRSFAYLPALTEFQESYVLEHLEPCDVYLCQNFCEKIRARYPYAYVFTTEYSSVAGVYSTVLTGDFTFRCFDDKMVFVR